QIWATAVKLADVATISGNSGAMRENLPDRRSRGGRIEVRDIVADRIVELQFAALAQFHDACRGEALRVRSDPKPVARSESFAGREIGDAESLVKQNLIFERDRDHAARLLRGAKLQF